MKTKLCLVCKCAPSQDHTSLLLWFVFHLLHICSGVGNYHMLFNPSSHNKDVICFFFYINQSRLIAFIFFPPINSLNCIPRVTVSLCWIFSGGVAWKKVVIWTQKVVSDRSTPGCLSPVDLLFDTIYRMCQNGWLLNDASYSAAPISSVQWNVNDKRSAS